MSSIANSWFPRSLSAAKVMFEPYRRGPPREWRTWPIVESWPAYTCFSIEVLLARPESYPLPRNSNALPQLIRVSAVVLATAGFAGCSANHSDSPPPTIAPAQPAQSPPVTGAPAGEVRPLPGNAQAAVFDPATTSLAVLSPGVGDQS